MQIFAGSVLLLTELLAPVQPPPMPSGAPPFVFRLAPRFVQLVEAKTEPAPVPPSRPKLAVGPARTADPSVTISWALDPQQALPAVLGRHLGAVGFGTGTRITHMFRAPDWAEVALPEEGVKLDRFYYLPIDETTGHYRMVDGLRGRNAEVRELKPYALLERSVAATFKEQVRRAAAGHCRPDDTVDARLRLNAQSDFTIEKIRCFPPTGEERP
jgi:hypothetical protein